MTTAVDRPTVMTNVVQRTIVQMLLEGNFLKTACEAAGITRHTFNYWRRLCEDGAEHAQTYADFFTSVKKASALAEAEALRKVRMGGPGWQSSAWFLERRFPKRWGRRAQVEATKQDIDVTKLSDEELMKIVGVEFRSAMPAASSMAAGDVVRN